MTPPPPAVSPVPGIAMQPPPPWPAFKPTYPKVWPAGLLVVALAYFSLGVAVGALLKHSPRARRWLPLLIVPGGLAALGFVAWVIRSLR